MIQLELESGITVMVSRRHYDFLKQMKKSTKSKVKRSSLSYRAELIANSLVASQLLNRDDEFYYILPFYETRNSNMKLSEDNRRKLKVINNTLRREYDTKVKFDESISLRTLKRIKADVKQELRTLSESATAETNPEYSQCLLVLEAVDILMGVKKDITIQSNSNVYEEIEQLEAMWKKLNEQVSPFKKDDSVDYLGHNAKLVNIDGDNAWIKVEGQPGTMEVRSKDIKPLQSEQPSLSKGTKVTYLGKDAEVVNSKGDSTWIRIPGQSGTMEINTSDLKVMTESQSKTIQKLAIIESKIKELKSKLYNESKEKEISMMLREDAQQAELIMASKGLLDTVHGFQTKIGALMNKDLDPFIERVRSIYGNETADKIYTNIDDSLMDLLETVKDTKSVFASVVATLSGDEGALESDMSGDNMESLPDITKDKELPDMSADDESDDLDMDDLDLDDLGLDDSEEGFTRKE